MRRDRRSAVSDRQSAVSDRRSAVGGQRSRPLTTEYSVLSTQYSVLSTQYSVLSTQYSVLSTQYSVLSAQCSVLSTQCSVLSAQYSVLSAQCSVLSTQYSVLSTQYYQLPPAVLDADQKKPLRRSGPPCQAAVGRPQHFFRPVLRPCASADLDQGADDRTDHIVEEAVGLDFQGHEISPPALPCSFLGMLPKSAPSPLPRSTAIS